MRVDELKNKILQLAIQGKLVPQDPNDEPASVLLERIKKEKEQLIKEKKIKKEKPLPEISEEEKAFEIPEGWEWCRLGQISKQITDGTHKTPNYITEGIPFLSIKNLSKGYFDFSDSKYISKEEHEQLKKRCNPEINDLLFCRIGTLGKFKVIDIYDEFSIFVSLGLIKLCNRIYPKYMEIVLNSPYLYNQYNKIKVDGSHTSKLNLIDMPKVIITLPPLQEQKRIVSKVDELFSIIDKLGENKEALSKNIDITRDKVLQLAIQGKLVPQDPDDEPASVLLEKIKKEKEQLIKEKKIKKEKPLPEISEEEKAFEIPEGWEWVRSSEIFNVRSAMRIHKTDWKEDGIPFLRGRELVQLSKYGRFNIEICIDEDLYENLKEKSGIPQKDDILVSAVGTIGKVYIVKESDKFYYKDAYILCFENFSGVYSKYIKYMLESPELQSQIKKDSMATTVAQLTIIKAKSLIIPLPPLEEQKRIVAKVDEIMNYLDKLHDLIDGKSLEVEGVQAKEIALSKAEELV